MNGHTPPTPHVYQARELWEPAREPQAKVILTTLLAFIGKRALAGEPPFDSNFRDGVSRLMGWLDDRYYVRVALKPHEHCVDIEVESRGLASQSRIAIPGEIVGIGPGSGYTSVYFSLTRGERHGNLYSLLDAVSAGIRKTMERTDQKLAQHDCVVV
ncbi:hypothetical protein [Paraburkholderia sp. SIMBA_054]|uniref:hypothetical protein n=1 Tax=Paraburkholderia sp. SIMBA_054 TaxID=3085795 RepID=UPI00397B16DF